MSIQPKRGTGPSVRPLLQRDIERAQSMTHSGEEAARYLNVNYETYKKYAKRYGLFEQHKNKAGRGIARPKRRGLFGLDEILAGKHPTYNRTKLKDRLIATGYLPHCCDLCDYKQQRYFDGKVPLVLHYRDGDHLNLALENLQLRCYNCTYLSSGRISVKHLVTGAELSSDANLSDEEIETLQNELMND
jgi:hypothetical protein